jgi:hypothetical protein
MKEAKILTITIMLLLAIAGMGCSALKSRERTSVKPIHHKGYYKKHVYKKHLAIGRLRINWFEKQGVKHTRR